MGRGREGQGTGGMEGKGRDARERGEKGRGGRKERRGGREGRKVRTPPPSIPAYAPVSRSSDIIHD